MKYLTKKDFMSIAKKAVKDIDGEITERSDIVYHFNMSAEENQCLPCINNGRQFFFVEVNWEGEVIETYSFPTCWLKKVDFGSTEIIKIEVASDYESLINEILNYDPLI